MSDGHQWASETGQRGGPRRTVRAAAARALVSAGLRLDPGPRALTPRSDHVVALWVGGRRIAYITRDDGVLVERGPWWPA